MTGVDRPRIFLSPPDVGDAERELLIEAFDSGWIAPVGPHLQQFEDEFAARHDAPAAVALASGTAALHLALRLVGVEPGDDVLVSTLTFVASANPIVYLGARPVFVDAERSTWNLDPEVLADAIERRVAAGRRPAAVVAVDVLGQCCSYEPVVETCDRFEIPLVEDAAEALGATYRGRPSGTFGRLGAFSFNGNKTITTGGGGMLIGTEADVARARSWATQAREPVPWYEHTELGYNYRLSNLLAAVGLAQFRRLDEIVGRQRAVNARYRAGLADVDGVEFMPDAADGEPTNWLTALTLDAGLATTPEQLMAALDTAGFEARPMWKPMHLQPLFADAEVEGGAVAEDIFHRGVCLPSGSVMTDDQVDDAIAIIRATLTS